MSRYVTQREFRNQSAEILRDVQSGETLIVTRNGTPVAELRPIQPKRFVSRSALIAARGKAPHIDYARFRADLDAVVDQVPDE